MPTLKRIILVAFLSLLVACGQKGALTLSDENYSEHKSPTIYQPNKAETKEANQ